MFQFPRLASAAYGFSRGRLGITPAGFPHSGIPGSLPACGSPRLIAACHALRRFPAPRHPPFALSSLTTFVAARRRISPGYTRVTPYSVVKDPASRTRSNLLVAGGDDRIRTGDPLLAKQVLSRLSYIPPRWWAFLGSNQGPRAYQARALAS